MTVKKCKHCQLVKESDNIQSKVEELNNIPICDLLYHVELDITRSPPETEDGNKYVMVAIDHYSN
jgi:hypothetical protein